MPSAATPSFSARASADTGAPVPTRLPRIMVTAPASGGGKTLVSCALLRILSDRGFAPVAFKCGPDYIDPQFHRAVTGRTGGNLDGFFSDGETLRRLMVRGSEGCGCAVIEGVMGYYDGLSIDSDEASSYAVARATGTPALLVLGARGAALTLAAAVRGIQGLRPGANVAGVLLNRCSEGLFSRLAPMIERECGVPVLGCLPEDDRFELGSRHLGLVGADEVADLMAKVDAAADALARTLDFDRLRAIMGSAPDLADAPYATAPAVEAGRAVVAVARDAAFNFYYAENLRMLEDLGARLIAFSPLADEELPADATALYLGGGYPELHARELSENEGMRGAVARAIASGMPTVAECGGFLYLQRELADADGGRWPMVGALPGSGANGGRLGRFGYVALTAREPGLYGPAGTELRGHEFHYWRSDAPGSAFEARKPSGASWDAAFTTSSLVAGFPHAYWPSNPVCAERFVRAAAAFGGSSKEGGR